MKNEENMREENKCEETLYNENQATPVDETQTGEVVKVEQDPKKDKKTAWRSVGVGMGLGILLGSTSSFVVPPLPEGEEELVEPDKETNHTETGQQEWTDGMVEMATAVNDEMSFSEAFGAARAEVGSGGAFEWRGNVYSTYTAEEWDNMTPEEKDAYYEHFNWSHQEAADDQAAATEPAAEQVQEEPEVEVAVDVQETTPEMDSEVEILGVVHDDETGTNLGLMSVDDQEFLFIDVDDNGEFDVVVSDVNGDGQITVDEGADISDYHMTVDEFQNNTFGDTSMVSYDDDTPDYINDADAVYEV